MQADQQILFWNDGQNGQHYVILNLHSWRLQSQQIISKNDALRMGALV